MNNNTLKSDLNPNAKIAEEAVNSGNGSNSSQQQQQQEAALRFEDLTIDDELCLLDRVVRYCRSNIALQRLVHVKMLPEAAEEVGPETTIAVILPLCTTLVSDTESIIRQHLALQLLPFVKSLNKAANTDAVYKVIMDIIINRYLSQMIVDVDADVRKAAGESLVGIAKLLRMEDRQKVVNIILQVSIEYGMSDDLRMTGASIMGQLASVMNGQDLSKAGITPALFKLSADPVLKVRRAACQAIPLALSNASPIYTTPTPFIDAFEKLSQDEVYRIRRSCAEGIVDLGRALHIAFPSSDLNRLRLIPICTKLLHDDNKLVKQGMMQFLGPFIVSFLPGQQVFPHPSPLNPQIDKDEYSILRELTHSRNINPPDPLDIDAIVQNHLLYHFCAMASIDTNEPIVNTELRVYCAYSLPAVLLLLGPEYWNPYLQKTFFALASSEIPGVRRCLASSFHAIAHILGPTLLLSSPQTLSTYNLFLKHEDDITRMNAIKHISSLLTILPTAKRETFLPILKDILNSSFASSTYLLNWRLRDVLSQQFPSLIPLFQPNFVKYYILPMIYTLSSDPVCKVREHTYTSIPILFRTFQDDPEASQQLISHLQQMVMNYRDFSYRQGYCTICTYLAQDTSLQQQPLIENLLPPALALKDDKVQNVRWTLYKALLYMPNSIQELASVKPIIQKLSYEAEIWDNGMIMSNETVLKTPLLLKQVKEELNNYSSRLAQSAKTTDVEENKSDNDNSSLASI